MVKLVYPELQLEDPVFLDHRQRFLDMYGADIAVDTDLFSGMYPLLEELEENDIPWGIVTNKPRWLSEALLKALNLTERCAVLVCPEDVTRTKPDPEPMYLAAEQLQLAAEDCIYVGTIHVILMQAAMPRCIPYWQHTVIYHCNTKMT